MKKLSYIAGAGLLTLVVTGAAGAQQNKEIELYKSPYCGCCTGWADHMKAAGFVIKTHDVEDMNPIKLKYGVSGDLQSCHTAIVDGHVIEGHVPAEDVQRLLAEGGEKSGLSVPGMPIGSPGMEQGDIKEPYQVIRFNKSERTVFAQH